MKALLTATLVALISVSAANTDAATTKTVNGKFETRFGNPTYKQVLHYRKMYEKKPFPDAEIYYYDNGVYKIISQGEDHYGLYVLQGGLQEQTYTIRFVSLPSADWGSKTAFHQLTFIKNDKGSDGVFIQNAIVDTGEAIAQQNGTFSLEENKEKDPTNKRWGS